MLYRTSNEVEVDSYQEQLLVTSVEKMAKDIREMLAGVKSIAEDAYRVRREIENISKEVSRIESKMS